MEHDFYVGIGLAIVLTYLIKTQGPAYTAEYVNVINLTELAFCYHPPTQFEQAA